MLKMISRSADRQGVMMMMIMMVMMMTTMMMMMTTMMVMMMMMLKMVSRSADRQGVIPHQLLINNLANPPITHTILPLLYHIYTDSPILNIFEHNFFYNSAHFLEPCATHKGRSKKQHSILRQGGTSHTYTFFNFAQSCTTL